MKKKTEKKIMKYAVFSMFIFAVAILICIYSNLNWSYYNQSIYFDGLVIGLLGVLLTLITIHVANQEIGKNTFTNSADVMLRLKNDFFCEKTRRILHLLSSDYLEFINNETFENSYFRVAINKIKKSKLHDYIKKDLAIPPAYTLFDLDDLLLGHFEDIAILKNNEIFDFNMVHAEFSYYIENVWENEDIKKYLLKQWKDNEEVYKGFMYLYFECKKKTEENSVKNNNNLQTKNPLLSNEWHKIKNGVLKPWHVTPNSDALVWWSCRANKEHEWLEKVKSRNIYYKKIEKHVCPFCKNE